MREYCGSEHYEVRAGLNRRGFLKATGAAAAGSLALGGMNSFVGNVLAAGATAKKDNRPKMILLWMGGGPTHIDTWDPKPDSPNGGILKGIPTGVPGVQISEALPEMAKIFKTHFSIIRGLNTREGAHERGTWLMHTGSPMIPGDDKPFLGSFIGFEHGNPNLSLPPVWSIRSGSHPGGFLGAAYSPYIVGDPMNPVNNLKYYAGIDKGRFDDRLAIMNGLEAGFEAGRPDAEGIKAHRKMYEKANAMIHDPSIKDIIDLKKLDKKEIERYSPAAAAAGAGRMMGGGGNGFGMGLLLAKRLVENGVSCVEVGLGGWDMHNNLKPAAEGRMHEFDKPLAALLEDLKSSGQLDNTLVVWMGEFGRTPKINGNAGRDHWGQSCNVMVAGGGIQPGRIAGDSGKDGYGDKDMVDVYDVFRTFGKALKLDCNKNYYSKTGRPTRIVEAEKGKACDVLFA
jgi:hypothetical protein